MKIGLMLIGSLLMGHAQAQILDTDKVLGQINRVERQLDNIEGRVEQQVEPALPETAKDIRRFTKGTQTLLEPLGALPDRLVIPDINGQPLWTEVTVEDGWRAIEREWLVLFEADVFSQLKQLPVEIIEVQEFKALGLKMVRFRVPPELDSKAALLAKFPTSIQLSLDRNHIYSSQNSQPEQVTDAIRFQPVCESSIKIGMIDTAIQLDHAAFSNSQISTKDFLQPTLSAPKAHGTAIAGILVGKGKTFNPLLPKAQLFAASVFYHQSDYAQGATMLNLVRALNWLSTQQVGVINMSLAGPDNQILDKVIKQLSSRDIAIIAAAGNEGPAAPAVYPAAYDEVIAATATDSQKQIYRWANRGDYIDFAARGVAVKTARSNGEEGYETGTSMAAPVISAFLACALTQSGNKNKALSNLQQQAKDLGATGRDPVFGFGLLEPALELRL